MAEDTANDADPSMEEILASIRKIISDDKSPEAAAPVEPAAEPEEVIELTQEIQEDGSVLDVKAQEEPPPPPPPVPEPPPSPPPPPESLVSDPIASTAASTFSSLANTLEIERLASGMSGATFLGNGHRTLEDMVIELMRPLLKDWLDKNLPAVVERLVQKEIDRIAHRS
ncbi:MAG: DUF2497 domain-containing protein [Alphaproteobacteria bacterium]|nr:DUF2497 domain-containing protein [Alphaproteobacteria bacterium]